MFWYTIKRFFRFLFYTLGVIFFLIICTGAYLWFADPFEIRPLLEGLVTGVEDVTTTVTTEVTDKATEDKHPALSATQERALEVVGIDPANVPTTITPEQEACFTEKLGAERVAQIKAGGTPSATEIFKARACVE
jgi:hypothetical protein